MEHIFEFFQIALEYRIKIGKYNRWKFYTLTDTRNEIREVNEGEDIHFRPVWNGEVIEQYSYSDPLFRFIDPILPPFSNHKFYYKISAKYLLLTKEMKWIYRTTLYNRIEKSGLVEILNRFRLDGPFFMIIDRESGLVRFHFDNTIPILVNMINDIVVYFGGKPIELYLEWDEQVIYSTNESIEIDGHGAKFKFDHKYLNSLELITGKTKQYEMISSLIDEWILLRSI